MNERSRCWCFTSFLLNEDFIQACACSYIVYGREKCPETSRIHLQGYIEFSDAKTMSSVKKLFNDKTLHLERRKGTAEQASQYCKKDNDFFEKGSLSRQGQRTDLTEIINEVSVGTTSVDTIVMTRPELFHQYGRTLDRAEDIRMRSVFRTEMTTCEWVIGPTGSGKSHYAFSNYTPTTHYKFKYDGEALWQDDYKQQPILVINEFRGQIPYAMLLEMIDKFPFELRRRNRPPLPFTSKHIIITSVLPPEEVYCHLSKKDTLQQLLRRITIKELKKRN